VKLSATTMPRSDRRAALEGGRGALLLLSSAVCWLLAAWLASLSFELPFALRPSPFVQAILLACLAGCHCHCLSTFEPPKFSSNLASLMFNILQ